jgi:peptidyl-tRNA hydrolase
VDAGSSPVERAQKPTTHYCVVREDLSRGVLAAQLVHAAGESSTGDLPADTHAVVLAARDEAHLALIEQELIRRGIAHKAIREPDRDNELMAIGVLPLVDRTTIKPVTGKLRLLA